MTFWRYYCAGISGMFLVSDAAVATATGDFVFMSNAEIHAELNRLAAQFAEHTLNVPTEANYASTTRYLERMLELHRASRPDATL
jgi:UDP-glucose 4-epimerase